MLTHALNSVYVSKNDSIGFDLCINVAVFSGCLLWQQKLQKCLLFTLNTAVVSGLYTHLFQCLIINSVCFQVVAESSVKQPLSSGETTPPPRTPSLDTELSPATSDKESSPDLPSAV